MIDKPDQPESLTMTRRDWARVAAALAIHTYTAQQRWGEKVSA